MADTKELASVIAQLRHAYANLACGTVKDQKQFADGLIAPQIRALETIASRKEDVDNSRPATHHSTEDEDEAP